MSYAYKFQKYATKNKLLSNKIYASQNKSWVQEGGEIPLHKYLKNIGLFEPETQIDDFLNPIFGYMWIKTNAIQNYWMFDGFRSKLHNFIGAIFFCLPETNSVKPNKKIYETIRPYDIGRYIAWKFTCLSNHTRRVELEDRFNLISQIVDKLGKMLQITNAFFRKAVDKESFAVTIKKNMDSLGLGPEIEKIISLISEVIDSPGSEPEIEKITLLISELNEHKKTVTEQKRITEIELKKFCKEDRPVFGSDMADSRKLNEVIDLIDRGFVYDDMDFYHALLAILISVATNKEGIKQYYEGINSVKTEDPIVIPDGFETDVFTADELFPEDENDDFYKICILLTKSNANITLQNYGYSNLHEPCELSIPECGETSLRNFIKIITYNERTGKYDMDIMDRLGATEQVKEFFTVFDTEGKQNDDKTVVDIFGKRYNIRDAWLKVTSQLEGVSYVRMCTDGHNIVEINDGLDLAKTKSNMLQVITQLFRNVEDWNSFSRIVGVPIVINLDVLGHGHVQVANIYMWHFGQQHYWMTQNNSERAIKTKSFNPNRQFYIDMLKGNKTTVEHPHVKDYFYFQRLTKEMMIDMLNEYEEMDDLDYEALLTYDKFTKDDKKRIYIKMHKIVHLNKIQGIQFVPGAKKTLENIKFVPNLIISPQNIKSLMFMHNLESITFNPFFNQALGASLEKLTNLQTLTFGRVFDQPLGASLEKLTNLQSLTFGDSFDQPLGASLEKLTNLETLVFGEFFNQPLGTSLDKLTNLQTLKFADYHDGEPMGFNQPLGESLDELKKLRVLNLGATFNQPLGRSLDELTNLQNLYLTGDRFNQPLGTSLDKLTNLQTLSLSVKQPLGTSLDKLTNLQTLTLRINQPLGASLDKLTNLRTLSLYLYINQPLGTSLEKLTNLQSLRLERDFNQPLGKSLEKLTNLKFLTFGYNFDKELDTSLDELKNLESLVFGKKFITDLEVLLPKFPKLKKLFYQGKETIF